MWERDASQSALEPAESKQTPHSYASVGITCDIVNSKAGQLSVSSPDQAFPSNETELGPRASSQISFPLSLQDNVHATLTPFQTGSNGLEHVHYSQMTDDACGSTNSQLQDRQEAGVPMHANGTTGDAVAAAQYPRHAAPAALLAKCPFLPTHGMSAIPAVANAATAPAATQTDKAATALWTADGSGAVASAALQTASASTVVDKEQAESYQNAHFALQPETADRENRSACARLDVSTTFRPSSNKANDADIEVLGPSTVLAQPPSQPLALRPVGGAVPSQASGASSGAARGSAAVAGGITRSLPLAAPAAFDAPQLGPPQAPHGAALPPSPLPLGLVGVRPPLPFPYYPHQIVQQPLLHQQREQGGNSEPGETAAEESAGALLSHPPPPFPALTIPPPPITVWPTFTLGLPFNMPNPAAQLLFTLSSGLPSHLPMLLPSLLALPMQMQLTSSDGPQPPQQQKEPPLQQHLHLLEDPAKGFPQTTSDRSAAREVIQPSPLPTALESLPVSDVSAAQDAAARPAGSRHERQQTQSATAAAVPCDKILLLPHAEVAPPPPQQQQQQANVKLESGLLGPPPAELLCSLLTSSETGGAPAPAPAPACWGVSSGGRVGSASATMAAPKIATMTRDVIDQMRMSECGGYEQFQRQQHSLQKKPHRNNLQQQGLTKVSFHAVADGVRQRVVQPPQVRAYRSPEPVKRRAAAGSAPPAPCRPPASGAFAAGTASGSASGRGGPRGSSESSIYKYIVQVGDKWRAQVGHMEGGVQRKYYSSYTRSAVQAARDADKLLYKLRGPGFPLNFPLTDAVRRCLDGITLQDLLRLLHPNQNSALMAAAVLLDLSRDTGDFPNRHHRYRLPQHPGPHLAAKYPPRVPLQPPPPPPLPPLPGLQPPSSALMGPGKAVCRPVPAIAVDVPVAAKDPRPLDADRDVVQDMVAATTGTSEELLAAVEHRGGGDGSDAEGKDPGAGSGSGVSGYVTYVCLTPGPGCAAGEIALTGAANGAMEMGAMVAVNHISGNIGGGGEIPAEPVHPVGESSAAGGEDSILEGSPASRAAAAAVAAAIAATALRAAHLEPSVGEISAEVRPYGFTNAPPVSGGATSPPGPDVRKSTSRALSGLGLESQVLMSTSHGCRDVTGSSEGRSAPSGPQWTTWASTAAAVGTAPLTPHHAAVAEDLADPPSASDGSGAAGSTCGGDGAERWCDGATDGRLKMKLSGWAPTGTTLELTDQGTGTCLAAAVEARGSTGRGAAMERPAGNGLRLDLISSPCVMSGPYGQMDATSAAMSAFAGPLPAFPQPGGSRFPLPLPFSLPFPVPIPMAVAPPLAFQMAAAAAAAVSVATQQVTAPPGSGGGGCGVAPGNTALGQVLPNQFDQYDPGHCQFPLSAISLPTVEYWRQLSLMGPVMPPHLLPQTSLQFELADRGQYSRHYHHPPWAERGVQRPQGAPAERPRESRHSDSDAGPSPSLSDGISPTWDPAAPSLAHHPPQCEATQARKQHHQHPQRPQRPNIHHHPQHSPGEASEHRGSRQGGSVKPRIRSRAMIGSGATVERRTAPAGRGAGVRGYRGGGGSSSGRQAGGSLTQRKRKVASLGGSGSGRGSGGRSRSGSDAESSGGAAPPAAGASAEGPGLPLPSGRFSGTGTAAAAVWASTAPPPPPPPHQQMRQRMSQQRNHGHWVQDFRRGQFPELQPGPTDPAPEPAGERTAAAASFAKAALTAVPASNSANTVAVLPAATTAPHERPPFRYIVRIGSKWRAQVGHTEDGVQRKYYSNYVDDPWVAAKDADRILYKLRGLAAVSNLPLSEAEQEVLDALSLDALMRSFKSEQRQLQQ